MTGGCASSHVSRLGAGGKPPLPERLRFTKRVSRGCPVLALGRVHRALPQLAWVVTSLAMATTFALAGAQGVALSTAQATPSPQSPAQGRTVSLLRGGSPTPWQALPLAPSVTVTLPPVSQAVSAAQAPKSVGPAPPSLVVAAPGMLSANVSWHPSSTNASALKGYTVWVNPVQVLPVADSGNGWQHWQAPNVTVLVGPGGTHVVVNNLDPGVQYTVAVAAVGLDGLLSSLSWAVQPVIPCPQYVPNSPIPGLESLNLTWPLPPVCACWPSPVTKYRLTWFTSSMGVLANHTVALGNVSWFEISMTRHMPCKAWFQITAYTDEGGWGPQSLPSANAPPWGPPSAPTHLSVAVILPQATGTTAPCLNASWSPPTDSGGTYIDHYIVSVTGGNGTLLTRNQSALMCGWTPSLTWVNVSAVALDISEPSPAVSWCGGTPPAPTVSGRIAEGNNSNPFGTYVSLAPDPFAPGPFSASYCLIYRSPCPISPWGCMAGNTTNSSSIAQGMERGVLLQYCAECYNSLGPGDMSPWSSFIQAPLATSAPGPPLVPYVVNVTNSSFVVVPVPPADTGSSPLHSYMLTIWDTVNGTKWSVPASVGMDGPPLPVPVLSLAPNRTYSVVVQAINMVGVSNYSALVSVTTSTGVYIPLVTNVTCVAVGATSVTFGWNSLPGLPSASFQVHLVSPGQGFSHPVLNTSTTSVSFTGLTPGVPYFANVVPVVDGVDGPRSYRSPWPCYPGLPVPVAPGVEARGALQDNQFGLNITLTPADSTVFRRTVTVYTAYPNVSTAYRASGPSMELEPYQSSLTLWGLPYNAWHFLRAFDTSSAGSGATLETLPARYSDDIPPPSPTNVTVTASSTSLTLSWTGYEGVPFYNLSVFNTSFGPSPIFPQLLNCSSVTLDVTPNITYVFSIAAVSVSGLVSDMALSPPAAAGASPPGAVRNITAGCASQPGVVSLSWAPPVVGSTDSPVLGYTVTLNATLQASSVQDIVRQTSACNLTVGGLAVGVAYTLFVSAYSAVGTGAPVAGHGRVLSCVQPPGSPTTVRVTVIASGSEDSKPMVLVQWNPPIDMGDGNAVQTVAPVYNLFRADAGADAWPLLPSTTSTWVTLGWDENTTCSIIVLCTHPVTKLTSLPSSPSGSVQVSSAALAPPDLVRVIVDKRIEGLFHAVVTVAEPDVDVTILVYNVLQGGGIGDQLTFAQSPCANQPQCIIPVLGNSTTLSGAPVLPLGQSYSFVAVASNDNGVGQASLPVTQLQQLLPPDKPNCNAVPGDSQVEAVCVLDASDIGTAVVALSMTTSQTALDHASSGPTSRSQFVTQLDGNCSVAVGSCYVRLTQGGLHNGHPVTVSVLAVAPTLASDALVLYAVPTKVLVQPWQPLLVVWILAVAVCLVGIPRGVGATSGQQDGSVTGRGHSVSISTSRSGSLAPPRSAGKRPWAVRRALVTYRLPLYHALCVAVAAGWCSWDPARPWVAWVLLGGSAASAAISFAALSVCQNCHADGEPCRRCGTMLAQRLEMAEEMRFRSKLGWARRFMSWGGEICQLVAVIAFYSCGHGSGQIELTFGAVVASLVAMVGIMRGAMAYVPSPDHLSEVLAMIFNLERTADPRHFCAEKVAAELMAACASQIQTVVKSPGLFFERLQFSVSAADAAAVAERLPPHHDFNELRGALGELRLTWAIPDALHSYLREDVGLTWSFGVLLAHAFLGEDLRPAVQSQLQAEGDLPRLSTYLRSHVVLGARQRRQPSERALGVILMCWRRQDFATVIKHLDVLATGDAPPSAHPRGSCETIGAPHALWPVPRAWAWTNNLSAILRRTANAISEALDSDFSAPGCRLWVAFSTEDNGYTVPTLPMELAAEAGFRRSMARVAREVILVTVPCQMVIDNASDIGNIMLHIPCIPGERLSSRLTRSRAPETRVLLVVDGWQASSTPITALCDKFLAGLVQGCPCDVVVVGGAAPDQLEGPAWRTVRLMLDTDLLQHADHGHLEECGGGGSTATLPRGGPPPTGAGVAQGAAEGVVGEGSQDMGHHYAGPGQGPHDSDSGSCGTLLLSKGASIQRGPRVDWEDRVASVRTLVLVYRCIALGTRSALDQWQAAPHQAHLPVPVLDGCLAEHDRCWSLLKPLLEEGAACDRSPLHVQWELIACFGVEALQLQSLCELRPSVPLQACLMGVLAALLQQYPLHHQPSPSYESALFQVQSLLGRVLYRGTKCLGRELQARGHQGLEQLHRGLSVAAEQAFVNYVSTCLEANPSLGNMPALYGRLETLARNGSASQSPYIERELQLQWAVRMCQMGRQEEVLPRVKKDHPSWDPLHKVLGLLLLAQRFGSGPSAYDFAQEAVRCMERLGLDQTWHPLLVGAFECQLNFLEQQNSGEGHEAHKREVRKRYNMLLDLHVRESQKRLGSLVLQNTFSHAIVDNKIAMVGMLDDDGASIDEFTQPEAAGQILQRKVHLLREIVSCLPPTDARISGLRTQLEVAEQSLLTRGPIGLYMPLAAEVSGNSTQAADGPMGQDVLVDLPPLLADTLASLHDPPCERQQPRQQRVR